LLAVVDQVEFGLDTGHTGRDLDRDAVVGGATTAD
jgi:hypothetical protein